EDVERERGIVIPARFEREQLAHVVRHARQPEKARAAVQYVLELARPVAEPHEMHDRTGVEIARAGPHDETLERREAHARVHGTSVVECRRRAPLTEVQRDRAPTASGGRERPGEILVRDTVEAVAPYTVMLAEVSWDRIMPSGIRQIVEECRVEHGDHRHVRKR